MGGNFRGRGNVALHCMMHSYTFNILEKKNCLAQLGVELVTPDVTKKCYNHSATEGHMSE